MARVERPEIGTISIHALREEGDVEAKDVYFYKSKFLSTPSARRATGRTASHGHDAGSYFYPRPPRGGRQGALLNNLQLVAISIHALREEGDRRHPWPTFIGWYFYPRPPRGGRRHSGAVLRGDTDFYPRPPRGGRPFSQVFVRWVVVFLSTPSARRATWLGNAVLQSRGFLSTPSARRATFSCSPAIRRA